MPTAVANGLETTDAGTDLDALHNTDLLELLENPVDACAGYAPVRLR